MTGRPLSSVEHRHIVNEYQRGVTADALAGTYGVSKQTIYNHLRREGIALQTPRLADRPAGYTKRPKVRLYDEHTPAREKTPFGDFELRPSHLKTGRVSYMPVATDIRVTRSAAVTVCDQVELGRLTRDQVPAVLAMLGLVDALAATS